MPHWRVVFGLGGVWILDGLEVTMVGNVASRLTQDGSGIELTAAEIGKRAPLIGLLPLRLWRRLRRD